MRLGCWRRSGIAASGATGEQLSFRLVVTRSGRELRLHASMNSRTIVELSVTGVRVMILETPATRRSRFAKFLG
jgi:hypothetical protein